MATGGLVRRVCLVLDCVTPQDYCPHTTDLINLQHYVITKKKLAERDALTIFYNIVSVVHSLHEVGNILIIYFHPCNGNHVSLTVLSLIVLFC